MGHVHFYTNREMCLTGSKAATKFVYQLGRKPLLFCHCRQNDCAPIEAFVPVLYSHRLAYSFSPAPNEGETQGDPIIILDPYALCCTGYHPHQEGGLR
jgi:hypothetical protein